MVDEDLVDTAEMPVPPVCLLQRNPGSGFESQHGTACARVQEHTDQEIRVNGHAEFHALFGVSKDHPHGSACLHLCAKCATWAEKKGAVVTGIIQ